MGHPRMSKSFTSESLARTTESQRIALPGIADMEDVEPGPNLEYGKALPTVRRRVDSAPATLRSALPHSQNNPDYSHEPRPSSSLSESSSLSQSTKSNLAAQHQRDPPALDPTTCILILRKIAANPLPCSQNEGQSSQSSPPAPSLLWPEDPEPPLLPPPHTYGRPIPLPLVDDDDTLPDYTNSPEALSHTSSSSATALFAPPEPPRFPLAQENKAAVEHMQNPSPASGTSRAPANFDSGIFDDRTFFDWNATPPDSSYIFCDGGIPRYPSGDGARLGLDQRRVEEWRHGIPLC